MGMSSSKSSNKPTPPFKTHSPKSPGKSMLTGARLKRQAAIPLAGHVECAAWKATFLAAGISSASAHS
jgi:hypothetical protein